MCSVISHMKAKRLLLMNCIRNVKIPHISIPLYNQTNKCVSYDVYNDEHGEHRCYSNSS